MGNKVKLVLYYVCALLSAIILYGNKMWSYIDKSPLLVVFSVVNIILVVIVTILLFKKSLNNFKVITPIIYIIFFIIMTMIIMIFNQKLQLPYLLCSYYVTFILIGYTVLNIYMLLSFEKK